MRIAGDLRFRHVASGSGDYQLEPTVFQLVVLVFCQEKSQTSRALEMGAPVFKLVQGLGQGAGLFCQN